MHNLLLLLFIGISVSVSCEFTSQRNTQAPNILWIIAEDLSEVVKGNASVRVLFDKVYGADEYFVRYRDDTGTLRETEKTIGTHIDISNLQNGDAYLGSLIAINAKGESEASEKMELAPNGKLLPPIIWDVFIADQKLVIGYSSEKEDEFYTVQYGETSGNMDQEFTSNVRGMISIEVGEVKNLAVKIKRITPIGESNWSNVVRIPRE